MTRFSRRHPAHARVVTLVLLALACELLAPIGAALAQQAPVAGSGAPSTPPPAAVAPPAPTPVPRVIGPAAPVPAGGAAGPAAAAPGSPGVAAPQGAAGRPGMLAPLAPPVPGTAGRPLPAGALPGVAPVAPAPAERAATPGAAATPQPDASREPAAQAAPASGPRQAPATASPSPIEQAVANPRLLAVDRNLRQFGYNLFEAPLTTFAPVDSVPVAPDYVIGPGDTLYVNIWGLAESSFQVTVDRNGEILLPRAGPVRVWGMKFADMEKLVRDQLAQYYQRVNVAVTMGPLRTMKIFVLGDVVQPGTYTLSSLATMTNALFAAGGPSKQGSLRDVRLIRGNRIVARMDLYRFLLEGSREGDERLLADDTIFVPPIGPVVALAGLVKRPAIYELKGETTLAQLLDMAGGLTILSYIRRVQVERVVDRHRKVALDLEFADARDFETRTAAFRVQEGDFVSVFSIDSTLQQLVQIEGNVRRPGAYALKPGMRVRDLLDEAEGLLPGTHMARADLARFRDGRQFEIVPLDLTALVVGPPEANPVLNEFDRLTVYHVRDVQPAPSVQISGSVHRAGVFELTPNMRVSDLLFRGAPTRQASLQNAELYRAEPGRDATVIRLDLTRPEALGRGPEDLLLTDRDHLYIRELAQGVEKRTVTISGRVRYPGEYAIAPEERLSSLLERAGGLLNDAFPKGAVFTRASIREMERKQLEQFIRTQEQALVAESAAISAGAAELSQDKDNLVQTQAAVTAQRRELLRSLASTVTLGRFSTRVDAPENLRGKPEDILLEHGDTLYIPQTPTSVAVVGAVRNSITLLHEPGRDARYYLAQAGGATPQADLDALYILKPTGAAVAGFAKVRIVEAGDAIIVPISTEPKVRLLPLLRDIATILTGFTLPFATIVALLRT